MPPALVHRIIPRGNAMPPPMQYAAHPPPVQHVVQSKTLDTQTVRMSPPRVTGMLQQAAASIMPNSPVRVKTEVQVTPTGSPGHILLKPCAAKTATFLCSPKTPKPSAASCPATVLKSTMDYGVPPLPGAARPVPTPARAFLPGPSCKQETDTNTGQQKPTPVHTAPSEEPTPAHTAPTEETTPVHTAPTEETTPVHTAPLKRRGLCTQLPLKRRRLCPQLLL